MIVTLKMNICIFSGIDPFVVFAEACILMNWKIQTMCVKTNTCVSFTPPGAKDEDFVKILYYHHENFTICQRVVKIRLNERNEESSNQLQPDFSVINVPGRNENTKFDSEDFLTKIIGM